MPLNPTENNPFLRKLLDTYNSHRLDAFDTLLTEDCVLVRNGVEAHGREEVKAVLAKVYRAFPDIEYRLDDAVTAGDKIAIRWHGHATHHGEYLGVSPTGSKISYAGSTFCERRGDRIARLWVSADLLALLRSLSEAARARPSTEAHP
ncbi:MAG: ester cyclase [Myxococcales bacterium]